MQFLTQVENELSRTSLPTVHVGDEVEVHYLIKEGEKERPQKFIGQVIAYQGRGLRRTLTVRRIVGGEGVERIFPVHSPRVKDIVVRRRGDVRRAKLYYLRERTGKLARIRELVGAKDDTQSAGSQEGSST